MSKNNENKLVPKLRFPEFENDGEWEGKSLDSVGNVVASGDLDEKTFSPTKTSLHIYPVYSNSVSQEGIYGYSSAFKYKSDSVTITARGTLGVAFERKTDFVGIGRLLVISELKNTNANFLKENWNYKAKVPLENGGIPQLTAVKAKSISLLFPKLSEQQKIAACLSSLDEVITAESQKLEVLKDHKKGLLQNLLPQEGETFPKFRFKEFEDSGDWVEKTIDSIKSVLTDYVANGSFQSLRENLNVVDSEDFAFYVRLTDLRAGLGHTNQKYVDEDTYKFLNKSSLHGGELLMANIGANVGEVWQMPYINKPSTLAPNMLMIKFKKEVDSKYVFQFLASNQGFKNISKAISGSGHPKISKTDLRQVIVYLPPTIQEQQKIASNLSSLDDLINSQNQKLETLQLHKKGLLQGLFPNVNEVTE